MGLFGKAKPQGPDPEIARLAQHVNEAEIRYLEVQRREIANLIMASDPDLMVRSYERAWKWERETAENPDRLRADELSLLAKFPSFPRFDILGSRHFTTYAEARDMSSDEDLVERYLEIGRMLVFMRHRSDYEPFRKQPMHDKSEHQFVLDTVASEKDRRFRARIDEALRRCWSYRHGFDAGKGEPYAGLHETYSDAEVEVWQIPYGASPDNETGVHFKRTDEYGIYAVFTHDDGRRFESYYRTDSALKERQSLGR